MSRPVIEIKSLSKKYRLGEREPYRALRDVIARSVSRLLNLSQPSAQAKQNQDLWALKDVNLNVNQGEVMGVIGRNGAGKSTLLKILSRITEPTEGEVLICGRVASLLEVGTGFHPELTGRENIYLRDRKSVV